MPWFNELAQKIAEGGPGYLVPRAGKIPWTAGGAIGSSALTRLGEEIDPFSFFYYLGSKGWDAKSLTRVHTAIASQCALKTEITGYPKHGFYYPGSARNALFHRKGDGNSDLLWRLFRTALLEPKSVEPDDFDKARTIFDVGVAKLTQALFLINPRVFLPCDGESAFAFFGRNATVMDWVTYRRESEVVQRLFPGCMPYEINTASYMLLKELRDKEYQVWHSSTLVKGQSGPDYWDDFRSNSWIYHLGPGAKQSRQLHLPKLGDVVLVHTGMKRGRGVGIVHRNDHVEDWNSDQRLHVVWMNKQDAALVGNARRGAFSRARGTADAFRRTAAYEKTFELLDQARPSPRPSPDSAGACDLRELGGTLLIADSHLKRIVGLLEDKKQVIFQGPPGTGKTYLARELAACLAGDDDRVRLVQFHPSYAYEDFVQGFRPTLEHGKAGFVLRNGPLVQMAKAARESEEKHFLIIDEINRGNLSKVLGELYFLLEYRDEEMQLQYGDKSFSLPPNLYIIGTMNTADRSIARVDLALRRRFHFVEFHPDKPPIQGLLTRWIVKHAEHMQWVAQVVERANERLDDQHAAIGPSYFLRDGLDDAKVRMIWEHNVLPYIEERLFGQEDRLKEFSLDQLRGADDDRNADGDKPEDNDPTDANP